MRLFVAIRFSEELRRALLDAQTALRRQGASGNFTRPENLHLTLAFLGETEDVSGAEAAVEEACRGGAFELAVGGGGRFGDLWWAGVQEAPRLSALAEDLQTALRRRGFSIERRPFLPHITLARRLSVPRPPALAVPRTAMTVQSVSLMRSERIGGKLVYTELFDKRL